MLRQTFRKPYKQKETHVQQAYLLWLKLSYPIARRVTFSIPNAGKRDVKYAMRLKREGMTKGVLDLLMCIASDGRNGLFIEFKVGNNKLTDEQEIMKTLLENEGYKVVVCYTVEEAINETIKYLGPASKFRIS